MDFRIYWDDVPAYFRDDFGIYFVIPMKRIEQVLEKINNFHKSCVEKCRNPEHYCDSASDYFAVDLDYCADDC